MKNKGLETLATILMALVCTALILHLIIRVRDVDAGAPAAPEMRLRPPRQIPRLAPSKTAALPASPVLNLALYRELQLQALTAPDRDPFSFQPTAAQEQQARAAQEATSAAASGPPPPPPVPFKAVGYSVDGQGQLEAYLSDTQQIYVVREKTTFDKSYRVMRITPAMIEIEDESFNRLVELPFPK